MPAHTSEADTYKIEANHNVMIQVTGYNYYLHYNN